MTVAFLSFLGSHTLASNHPSFVLTNEAETFVRIDVVGSGRSGDRLKEGTTRCKKNPAKCLTRHLPKQKVEVLGGKKKL